jgi:hypothetical protein
MCHLIVGVPSVEVSLTDAIEALRGAGFDLHAGEFAFRRSRAAEPAIWVALPGVDARAIVTITAVTADVKGDGWQPWPIGVGTLVTGYAVSFHEQPFPTRGHSWDDPVESRYTVFTDDVVAIIQDWCTWRDAWCVPVPPTDQVRQGRYLTRLAASRLASSGIVVDFQPDPLMIATLTSEQVRAMHVMIDRLFLPGIRWHFPRDRRGARLVSLDETVRGVVINHSTVSRQSVQQQDHQHRQDTEAAGSGTANKAPRAGET